MNPWIKLNLQYPLPNKTLTILTKEPGCYESIMAKSILLNKELYFMTIKGYFRHHLVTHWRDEL